MTARRLGVLWALTALVSLVLPATAQAWWERIEKLSGPGPFSGEVYEFRVACFGEVTPAAAASRTAEASMSAARQAVRGMSEKERRNSPMVEHESRRLGKCGGGVGRRARRDLRSARISTPTDSA